MRGPAGGSKPGAPAPRVLCVDDDRDIAEILEAALTDEGYAVSCLYEVADNAVMRTIGRLEPDCVLLDSTGRAEYGEAWGMAAVIHRRARPVPVIMFSAHEIDVAEAEAGESDRATAAGFAAIVHKPFDLDELLAAVATATGQSVPFERGGTADTRRTQELVDALEAHGARDIKPSTMREWATFRNRDGALLQIYWWQGRGVYQLGRYVEDGRLKMLGQFMDLAAAIEVALPTEKFAEGLPGRPN